MKTRAFDERCVIQWKVSVLIWPDSTRFSDAFEGVGLVGRKAAASAAHDEERRFVFHQFVELSYADEDAAAADVLDDVAVANDDNTRTIDQIRSDSQINFKSLLNALSSFDRWTIFINRSIEIELNQHQCQMCSCWCCCCCCCGSSSSCSLSERKRQTFCLVDVNGEHLDERNEENEGIAFPSRTTAVAVAY